MHLSELPHRLLLPMLLVFLCACWMLGGVTSDATAADEWLILLSLPLLLVSGWILLGDGVDAPVSRWGLAAAAAILAVPLLQLLPMPAGLWGMPTARTALAADLTVAGVRAPALHWALAPTATEGALWSLLPAMAMFAGTLALAPRQRGMVVRAILHLVGANVLFAFFQAGLPVDSALRLYGDAGSGFGGLLANTNHQATALVIAMVLAVGCAVHARRRDQAGRGHPYAWVAYAAYAGACFLLLPLTTSRAGMALALPALAAVLVLTGAIGLHRRRRPSRRSLAMLAVVVLLAVVGIRAAIGWMAVDEAEELRHLIAAATLRMGSGQSPWGSGMGSFVQVFAQSAPQQLWMDVYVNHAHNEFAQWWLEAGVMGALVLGGILALLAYLGWRVMRMAGRDGTTILAASCLTAILAVLVHSFADFPLRTLTLMATVAALAGLMLGALGDPELGASPQAASIED